MNIFKRLLRRTSLYKAVFLSDDGKEVLKFLAIEAGAYRPSFVPGDPYMTAFNEGKRQVYSHILGIINQDEDIMRQSVQREQERMELEALTQHGQI